MSSILYLERPIGNQTVQRELHVDAEKPGFDLTRQASHPFNYDFSRIPIHPPEAGVIQTKLAINQPGDSYEQEADRTAEQVMRTSVPRLQPARPFGGGVPIFHTEASFWGGESLQLKRLQASDTGHMASPPSVHEALRSPGQPLDPASRAFMEPRFGYDFSGVRVHTGGAAEESARRLNANAYTVGHNIVFGAGRFAPGTQEGRRLIAHELSHVVQQGGGGRNIRESPSSLSPAPRGYVQRQTPPGGSPPGVSDTPLTVVARRIAELVLGPRQAAIGAFHGPVLTVIRDRSSGEIFVGLNTGVPSKLADVIYKDILAHHAEIWSGKIQVVHTDPMAMGGGHSEINALNGAVLKHEARLGRKMTPVEYEAFKSDQLEMENVWLRGAGRRLTIAPSCEHCVGIGKGVRATPRPAPTGPPAQETHGEIGVPEPGPGSVPDVGKPSVAESAVKLVVTEIALNVLFFALTYYINKWYAEKQARKFKNDLKGLLPEINKRIKSKAAEIAKKAKAFPLVYGNLTIVYTHNKYELREYNEGSMRLQNVAISHQNYRIPERMIKAFDPLSGNDPSYSLTFSVPLFEEKRAEKGASSLYNYRQLRKGLTSSDFKTRLSSEINLAKLVRQDSSLKTLVIRDMLGMLKDEDALVRLFAAASLSILKAKIAIPYIQEILPIASNDKQKEMIQHYLRELKQG